LVIATDDQYISNGTTFTTSIGGHAIDTEGLGTPLHVPYSTRDTFITSLAVSADIADYYDCIKPKVQSITSMCFCPGSASPCGKAGIRYLSAEAFQVTWYGTYHTTLGCANVADGETARVCTTVSYSSDGVGRFYDLTKNIHSVTVKNYTTQIVSYRSGSFSTENTDLEVLSSTIESMEPNYHYSETGRVAKDAKDFTVEGFCWWRRRAGGLVEVPDAVAFASVTNEVSRSTCINSTGSGNLETTNTAHLYTLSASSHPYTMSFTPPQYALDNFGGTIGMRVRQVSEHPLTITRVLNVRCSRNADGAKVAIFEVPEGNLDYFVYSVFTSGTSVPTPVAAKGTGIYTTIALSPDTTGIAANVRTTAGGTQVMCHYPPAARRARALSGPPLDEEGNPMEGTFRSTATEALPSNPPTGGDGSPADGLSAGAWAGVAIAVAAVAGVVGYMLYRRRKPASKPFLPLNIPTRR